MVCEQMMAGRVGMVPLSSEPYISGGAIGAGSGGSLAPDGDNNGRMVSK